MARSFATRYEDPNFLAYRDTHLNNQKNGWGGMSWEQADTEDRWKQYDQTFSEEANMVGGVRAHPSVKSAAEAGNAVPTAPSPGGGAAAGIAVPEPTVSGLAAYGNAGNQSNGLATQTGQIAGADAANPALGHRIYPQGLKQLAALAPRIY